MKKAMFIALSIVIFASMPAFSASLSVGTHASYFVPPESGATSTLMMGVDAMYKMGGYFSAQFSVENANYIAAGKQYSLTPITVSLIAHPYPNAQLNPYVGGGVGYYDKRVDGASDSTTGVHVMTGINILLQNVNAGFEIKYTVPDTRNMNVGYSSVTGSMVGGMYMEF